MKIKIKPHNPGEKYACSPKSIKCIFKETDVYISFGFLSRNFSFDSKDDKKAKINGTVIMGASINTRDGLPEQFYNIANISFYVINDINYDKEAEKVFTERYLPELYDWYKSVLERPETAIPGVEVFIVEWDNKEFKTHCYRYR